MVNHDWTLHATASRCGKVRESPHPSRDVRKVSGEGKSLQLRYNVSGGE